jgi:hypothetical protein
MVTVLYYQSVDTSTSPVGSCRRGSVGQFVSALTLGLAIAGAILLENYTPSLSTPWKVLVLVVPLVSAAAYIHFLLRDMRRLDELQLRVHLEAASVACLGTFVLVLLYPAIQYAGFVGQLRPVYVAYLMLALVGVGYLNAVRRYR